MTIFWRCFFLLATFAATTTSNEAPRIAIAVLTPRGAEVNQSIVGSILFTEADNELHISGSITGLPEGNYGFHIHELGDISTCDAAGAHFNPEGTTHGGRDHAVRHVGDLGNIVFGGANNPVATIDIKDSILSLRGANNIIGRTLVLHAQEDDLGLGGHETSLTTGNAGARVACGVIGVKSPAEPWNGAAGVVPSLLLFVVALFSLFSSLIFSSV